MRFCSVFSGCSLSAETVAVSAEFDELVWVELVASVLPVNLVTHVFFVSAVTDVFLTFAEFDLSSFFLAETAFYSLSSELLLVAPLESRLAGSFGSSFSAAANFLLCRSALGDLRLA